ncbi:MAG: glycine betaine ABC transporter substrate-binding protein [Chloroflexota bacterium]
MVVYRIMLPVITIIILLQLVIVDIAHSQTDGNAHAGATLIVVASQSGIENQLIGKIIVLLLRNAGFAVDDRTETPLANIRKAMKNGEIDIYPELTGFALAVYHNLPTDTLPTDQQRSYALAKRLDEGDGIIWLDPLAYTVRKALVVDAELWGQGIHTIDALARYMNENGSPLRICIAESYIDSGHVSLEALEEIYEFSFKPESVLPMAQDDAVLRLGKEACQVAWVTNTTNATLFQEEHELEDTRNYFPHFVPAAIIRQEMIDENPEIADILAPISTALTVEEIHELKATVTLGFDRIQDSGDEKSTEAAARSFLRRLGLLKAPPITVASASNPANLLLGKLIVLLLQNAGFSVNDQTGLPAADLRSALESGEIDIYPETTGEALTSHHNLPSDTLPADRHRSLALAQRLDEPQGIAWLVPTAYTLRKSLIVNHKLWNQEIHTISDLAIFMNENDSPLRLCIIDTLLAPDYDGLVALEETYVFRFKAENVLSMPQGETLQNLGLGECEVAVGTNIDGHITLFNERALEDDLAFFPYYVPAPVIRQSVLSENPKIKEALAYFVDRLTEAKMTELNALVNIGPDGIVNSGDEEDADSVARRFLHSIGLLEIPPLRVASTNSSESIILAKIIARLLQESGIHMVEQIRYPAEEIREALSAGEIDIYPEFSGTALTTYHNLETSALPIDSRRSYFLIKRMDEGEDILWLEPTEFVLSKSLVVRDAIRVQGIETIDDLAAYMNENNSPLRLCMIDTLYDNKNVGLKALEKVYEFSFQEENVITMPQAETLEGLNAEQCDVAVGTNTDSRVLVEPDHILEDTRSFYPAYVPAPNVRKETLSNYPNLVEVLTGFGQHLTSEVMMELNARVRVGPDGLTNSGDEESVDAVVTAFLQDAGLLGQTPKKP